MPANQTVLVLIHGHGVDASIWDSVYAELVRVASVMKSDIALSVIRSFMVQR